MRHPSLIKRRYFRFHRDCLDNKYKAVYNDQHDSYDRYVFVVCIRFIHHSVASQETKRELLSVKPVEGSPRLNLHEFILSYLRGVLWKPGIMK